MIPTLTFPPALLLKAQGIQVLFLDVDGVLTDGGLYISDSGESFKRFHTLDGHGLKLIQRAGVTPVVITGRDSSALRARLMALGITHAHYGVDDKYSAAQTSLMTLGLNWQQAGAMGDDWPDLPVMQRSALSCAPCNAHVEVKATADYVSGLAGGQGAVREVCDLLLMAQGKYSALLQHGVP